MPPDRYGTDKDVQALIRAARRAGWRVSVDGRTHLRWQAPDGGEFRCALTGGPSVVARVRSQLRRLDPATFGTAAGEERNPPPPQAPPPVVPRPPVEVDLKAFIAAASAVTTGLGEMLAASASYGSPDELADALREARNGLRAVEDQLRQHARAARRAR